VPAELGELLPDWLAADAQRRIWQGYRQFATDCTFEEVAAAVRDKIQLLGKKANPGLLSTSVPKMFEGPILGLLPVDQAAPPQPDALHAIDLAGAPGERGSS